MGEFKELKVWERSKDLAVEVYKLSNQGELAKDFGMRDQMRRSAVSVPSNIAEGDALGTVRQCIKHFYIARGSLAELRTQVHISWEARLVSEEKYNHLDKKCDEIASMITSLIKHRSNFVARTITLLFILPFL